MFVPYITSPGKFALMSIKSVKALIDNASGKLKTCETSKFESVLSKYEECNV